MPACEQLGKAKLSRSKGRTEVSSGIHFKFCKSKKPPFGRPLDFGQGPLFSCEKII
jgi:hypothetical protein